MKGGGKVSNESLFENWTSEARSSSTMLVTNTYSQASTVQTSNVSNNRVSSSSQDSHSSRHLCKDRESEVQANTAILQNIYLEDEKELLWCSFVPSLLRCIGTHGVFCTRKWRPVPVV